MKPSRTPRHREERKRLIFYTLSFFFSVSRWLKFFFLGFFLPVFGEVITTGTPGEYYDTVNNNVARSVMITVTVGSSGVNVLVNEPSPSASLVTGVTGVADVTVKQSSTTQTYAQILAAKNLTIPIVVTANGNTGAGGYQVIWSMLFPTLNTQLQSTQFFNLQMPVISPGVVGTLYFNMYYGTSVADYWLLTLPQGLTISQGWTTNNILEKATNASSTLTFSLVIPYTSVADLAEGTYWLNTYFIMSESTANPTLVANQLALLADLVDQGDVLVSGNTQTNFLTTAQKAVVRTNQVYLTKLITQIVDANTPLTE